MISIARRRILLPTEDEGAYVDLGLPSGLLWAQGNIVKDANGNYSMGNETDYGCYFSWGNIDGHNVDEGYNFGNNPTKEPYASTPGGQVSTDIPSNDSTHDAALACLGSPWHLPTKEDFNKLNNNTDKEWTTIDGVNGRKFMKKTDHSVYVFLPAAGYIYGTSFNNVGTDGSYWSSSWNSTNSAHHMWFYGSYVYPKDIMHREFGFSVRAVRSSN